MLEGDEAFFVSDYHPKALPQVIAATHKDPIEMLQLFARICDGVAAAHAQGIVHRDIKPENILIDAKGVPVVADFGICFVRGQARQTQTKERVGSAFYMAPELEDGRLEGSTVTPRCDVYSLGKLLYEMLVNDIFSREEHASPSWDLVTRTKQESLQHVRPLLDRTICRNPSDRMVDASEVATEARRVIPLVAGNYRAIGAATPQRCIFCGDGFYRRSDANEILGHGIISEPLRWAILHCETCGNVQWFSMRGTLSGSKWSD